MHNGVNPIYFNRASQKNEEIYIVMSGRGVMYLDGDQFEAEAGHVIVNRPGGAQALKNIGDVDLGHTFSPS